MSKLRVFIVIMLILLSVSSCARPAEQHSVPGVIGKPEKVEQEQVEKEKSKYDIFTKLKEPFDYRYEPKPIPIAQMRMDVPDNWEFKVRSAREICITPDDSSTEFKNVAFNITYSYATMLWYNETPISENCKMFEYEMPAMTYYVNGEGEYGISENYPLRHLSQNAKWCSEEGRILYGEDTDTLVGDGSGFEPIEDFQVLYYFVKWKEDVFMCFSAITPEDKKDNTKKMMEYMISSITYEPQRINSFTDVDLYGFHMRLPSSMNETGYDYTKYSSLNSIDATAGMVILSQETGKKLTKKDIDNGIGENIGSQMIRGSGYSCFYSPTGVKTVTIDGQDADVYQGVLTLSKDNTGEKLSQVYPYQIPTNCYLDIYYFKDKKHIVALMSTFEQERLHETVERLIESGNF